MFNIYEENTETLFDDVVKSFYIETQFNTYRLTKTYVGGIDENGNENIECAAFCDIVLSEVEKSIPLIMEILHKFLDGWKMDEETIFNSFPDTRIVLYTTNTSSLNETEDEADKIINLIKSFADTFENGKNCFVFG